MENVAQSEPRDSTNAERQRRYREAHPEAVAANNERRRAKRAAAEAREDLERRQVQERARAALAPGGAEADPVARAAFRQGFTAGEMLRVFREIVAGNRRGEWELLAYVERGEPPAAFYARLTSLGLWGAWEEWRASWRLRGRA